METSKGAGERNWAAQPILCQECASAKVAVTNRSLVNRVRTWCSLNAAHLKLSTYRRYSNLRRYERLSVNVLLHIDHMACSCGHDWEVRAFGEVLLCPLPCTAPECVSFLCWEPCFNVLLLSIPRRLEVAIII
ncbi:hypothetical protein HBI73_231510 [Parastagonospora nodorum]|nr:hypothetical protein HBI73_231510 [Parastagonospora nodorum]